MAIKTFSIDDKIYKKYSKFCKENGINMSKQIEFFISSQLAENSKNRNKYLDKIKAVRKGKFVDENFIQEFFEKLQGKSKNQ